MRFADFAGDDANRRRYWARSFVGWPRIARAAPNAGHGALARLGAADRLTGLVTQNVDRLHRKAGTSGEVELHGALAEVVCLGCGEVSSRADLQDRLQALNPGFVGRTAAQAPDGDADLEESRGFRVARCLGCGGDLKPHVVFFGEAVPRPRVDRAREIVGDSEALLVVGSSLVVFSGFRFVKQAHKAGIPVGIVNLGPTRGDLLAAVKVEGGAGAVLSALADALT